jgi:hypothetical protein
MARGAPFGRKPKLIRSLYVSEGRKEDIPNGAYHLGFILQACKCSLRLHNIQI